MGELSQLSRVVPFCEVPRLPRRANAGHKGTFGTVLVVAGSRGMTGAAILAGSAALRSGAGLVKVACPENVQAIVAAGNPCYTTIGLRQHVDGAFGEGVCEELVELARQSQAVVIGPGLGRTPATSAFVRQFLDELRDLPIVLDADGLFALSPFTGEFGNLMAPFVLTPHPGEFARLTGQPMPGSEQARCEQAVAFAQKFGQLLLLKGPNTLVTDGKRLYRNSTGNSGMATGGSGDVLSGVIGALLAQKLPGLEAAVLGAWVHGRAGDLAAGTLGQTALTAADLLNFLPTAFRQLESNW